MNEATVRDYLLGRLPENEREVLESAALQNEETYETIRAVETDLFDDYALNRLPAEDQRAFLERYGDRTDRISVARALSRRTGGVVAFRARRWMEWSAAAAIVIAVGSVLVRDMTQSGPATPIVRTPHPKIVIAAPVTPVVPPLLVPITLGGSRSAGTATIVTIPKDAETVRFRVRLNAEDRFDRYAMELLPAWRVDGLQATSENGELVVLADVPANALKDGKYELAVHGNGDDLGFVTVEVHRTE
jgi:hypothetical protein